jgi:hypothetical protein
MSNTHANDSLPLLLTFTMEYAMRKVQGSQVGLKYNGTHQLLPACVNDINLQEDNINVIKKNTNTLMLIRMLL